MTILKGSMSGEQADYGRLGQVNDRRLTWNIATKLAETEILISWLIKKWKREETNNTKSEG